VDDVDLCLGRAVLFYLILSSCWCRLGTPAPRSKVLLDVSGYVAGLSLLVPVSGQEIFNVLARPSKMSVLLFAIKR
jgi:hypothetical protein